MTDTAMSYTSKPKTNMVVSLTESLINSFSQFTFKLLSKTK